MESALYGIFTRFGEVSEIELVSAANEWDFWYKTNECENPVCTRFPWSNLYIQICSSWNITLRMLQSRCPNSVIILLSFFWLPPVLQPSKQTFVYEVTVTDLASSEVLRPTIM